MNTYRSHAWLLGAWLGLTIGTSAAAVPAGKPGAITALPSLQPAPAGGGIPGCDDAAYLAARKQVGDLYKEGAKSGDDAKLLEASKRALDFYARCGAGLSDAQRAWLLNDDALIRIRAKSGDCWVPLQKATELAAGDAKAAKAVAFNRRKCAEQLQAKDMFSLDDVAHLNALLRPGKETLPPPAVCGKPRVRIVTLKHVADPDDDPAKAPRIEYVLPDGKVQRPCDEMCDASTNDDFLGRVGAAADLNGDGLVELDIHTALMIGSSQGHRYDQNNHDLLLACGDGRYVVNTRVFEEEDENYELVYGFGSITPLERYDPKLWPRERQDGTGKKGKRLGKWVRVDADADKVE
jgi:hypothetical protein